MQGMQGLPNISGMQAMQNFPPQPKKDEEKK